LTSLTQVVTNLGTIENDSPTAETTKEASINKRKRQTEAARAARSKKKQERTSKRTAPEALSDESPLSSIPRSPLFKRTTQAIDKAERMKPNATAELDVAVPNQGLAALNLPNRMEGAAETVFEAQVVPSVKKPA
jgi:hypothetical protein